jgi:hypothetical protein
MSVLHGDTAVNGEEVWGCVVVASSLVGLVPLAGQRLQIVIHRPVCDRLYGLVVRVLGYRSGGPGSIHGTTKKK